MGTQAVRRIASAEERAHFLRHLLSDLDALDRMLAGGLIEHGTPRIGAEQEFCLVDRNFGPCERGHTLREVLGDPHFTTELAKYNLELNLDPQDLDGGALRRMDEQLRTLMHHAEKAAEELGMHVVLTGILPTLTPRHIELDHMTPSPRYAALDEVMRRQKGGLFELHIQGVDELITKHETIVFEACNTSFQLHLQLEPADAVDQYNWAQLIAAPVLAVSANSPILLGKELWAETRIALFQQSIDVRNSSTLIRERQPRVTFGTRWLRHSVTEVFKEDVVRYDMLLTGDLEDRTALEALDAGDVPRLQALALHNGTIYRWNRLCYGIGGGRPHLRVECRYVPSGPTTLDEMANMAFWTGLMAGMEDGHRRLWEKMPFRQVKANFFRAALSGLETKLNWFGEVYDTRELLERVLLPIAERGLRKSGVDRSDIRHYLGVVRQRLSSHNGAQWTTHAVRVLKEGRQKDIALRRATALMHRNAAGGLPVGEWEPASREQLTGDELALEKVYQIMTTDLLTVRPDDLVDLARRVMAWREVHHVPVEDERGQLVGLVTERDLREAGLAEGDDGDRTVRDVMRTELVTADPNEAVADVVKVMKERGFGCMPVVYQGTLVGLLSRTDLQRLGV